MTEWCFRPLSTVFQSYHSNSLHYSCLSWVSLVPDWALKCLAQGHSHEKNQRIQCGSNPGPLDCKSNTLPLSHVGLRVVKSWDCAMKGKEASVIWASIYQPLSKTFLSFFLHNFVSLTGTQHLHS